MKASISTGLLQAFIALNELKHFTRAAEHCHTSQSAFSVMIRKLEAAVGARLFERSTRKVTLTPEGELFAQVARNLIQGIDAAFDDMAEYVARRRGRVSIAALAVAGSQGPACGDCAVQGALSGRHGDPAGHAVRPMPCPAAAGPGGPGADRARRQLRRVRHQHAGSDPFYLVCRADHALAKKRRVRVANLAGHPVIHLAKSSSVRQHVDLLLRGVDTAHAGFEVEHLATVAGLVGQGLGISLVPELTLFQFRQMGLVAIPLEAGEPMRPILIVKRRDQALSLAAQAMLALIEKHIRPASSLRRQELV